MTFCPRDNSSLYTQKIYGVECKKCPRCKGMWLPFKSVKALYENHYLKAPSNYYGDYKLSFEYKSWKSDIDCPKDNNSLTTYKFQDVEIDICSECKGLWLDKGEFEILDLKGVGLIDSFMFALGRFLIEIIGYG
jgi:Zn-finger nucleic acid-binding protein